MGRSNTTGLPFLVGRPDAGSFTYHRKLPDGIGPLVAGRIDMSWMSNARDLDGRPTIKISLKTGDLRTARERWAVLHPQVEALVGVALVRARMKRGGDPGAPLPLNALGTDGIRRLAGQVRHDVLAADDASWDPSHGTPLGDVILALADDGATKADAEIAARQIEARLAKGMLARRDLASFDSADTEGEVEAAPDLLAEILKAGSEAVPGRLSEEATRLLMNESRRHRAIPSDVEALLNENGITLPREHPDRRALALAMLRAKVEAFRIVEARLGGAPTETPERPARLEAVPAETGPRVSEMRLKWIELFDPGQKSMDDNGLYVGRFIEMFGDLPVTAVTREMIRDYRDALARSARNMPRAVRALSFKEQLDWAKARPEAQRLSRQTVNRKGIGAMAACMRAAIKQEKMIVNPCSNQDLPLRKKDKLKRLPYSQEDLVKIFATPVYTAEQKRWIGGSGEAAFWMPLVALFTGARLEEIGQLLSGDIRYEEGIVYFDFIDLADEDEDEDEHVKHLKTENARRRVPVHPTLTELGFIDYVEAMRARRCRQLFPDLKPYRGRMTHNWSKWWARHTDNFVTTSRHKVFHSFRHKLIDRMRNQELDRDTIKALVGHASGDTTDMYGESISLRTRFEVLSQLTYPGLDLSHVRKNNPSLRVASLP